MSNCTDSHGPLTGTITHRGDSPISRDRHRDTDTVMHMALVALFLHTPFPSPACRT